MKSYVCSVHSAEGLLSVNRAIPTFNILVVISDNLRLNSLPLTFYSSDVNQQTAIDNIFAIGYVYFIYDIISTVKYQPTDGKANAN